MTCLTSSGKTTIAKNLGKANIKNVASKRDVSVEILETAIKMIMKSNILTIYGLVSKAMGKNYLH